jgi:hypothetical protein
MCHELHPVTQCRSGVIWWRRHRDATMVTSVRVVLGDVENGLSCHDTGGEPRHYHCGPF